MKSHFIQFTKMHGLGNDFIVIEDIEGSECLWTPYRVQRLCDRRFGIGADQILLLKKPQNALLDIRMEILNADGSIAEMCGNGIRAVALYLSRRRGAENSGNSARYQIETLAGVKSVEIQGSEVCVDMGSPQLGLSFQTGGERIEIGDQPYEFFEVHVGNPHAVFFVKNVLDFPLEIVGPQIENHPRFPKRTNVEFVEVIGEHAIQVRVWERGAGITLACGTGACAAAVASLGTGRVTTQAVAHGGGHWIDVQLPGGGLKISWKNEPEVSIRMLGPAVEVYSGAFNPFSDIFRDLYSFVL
jgi:diaminopimelate epimerase